MPTKSSIAKAKELVGRDCHLKIQNLKIQLAN